ncbi:MAG TPA: ATP-grasp domain-containing protein [Candidatus Acidoferrum sp.]|nr:ATP-grasp domain-containing protein [Candidatus Acidoferrum sp.]
MTNPVKRLLLFTAKLGYQTRSFEEAVHKLGVLLVYVTDRCHQLEDPWGDQAIPVHFETPEVAACTVVEAVRGQDVSAILALGDRPAVAAAYAARGLGVRYNHPAAVEACRSKLRMKEVFRDAGLNVPWFQKLPIDPAPEPSLLGISYPCVLKPLSLSASQGVVRANNREEFLAAATRIRRLLQSPEVLATREANLDQMLVEGYISGDEVAVEGLLTDGELRVSAIFDKPDPLEGPYFEETIYVTPSRFPEPTKSAIEECARDTVRALGLSHGPIHAEFRINERGVWPIEVAPRPIGGLCARSLRFLFREETEPIGLEELLVRHTLALPGWDSPREEAASGVMMIPVPKSGILEEVSGEAAARSVPGITDLSITARLHDAITTWPEGSSYLGFLFARGNTPEEVELALRQAHQKLCFKITPSLPVEHPATRRMTIPGTNL